MISKIEFYLPSSDGRSRIHGIQWIPEGKPAAVFQIAHGMIEYIDRYDEFARYLTSLQIAVVGHDHLGHGKTSKEEDFGYFADHDGAGCILGDMHLIFQYCDRQYSLLPHFMMGHSMGSFFLRRYIEVYQDRFSGIILLGTGEQPFSVLLIGNAIISLVSRWKGGRYRSDFLHSLVLGNYNRAFRPVHTSSDWLTRDAVFASAYVADPYCSFHFTCRAYQDFFKVMLSLKSKRSLKCVPEDLPVLLLSGEEDPVGQRGKGVKRVYQSMRAVGKKNIGIKLYPGARHELLNEINREEVFQDISGWALEQISKEQE